jgi:AcrR family transcriptional regulator
MSFRNKIMATRAKTFTEKRPKQAASTREQILTTAERLFLEKGFRATSVHEIAAASGFTTGALYWHFGNKDELFLELLERRLEQTMAIFQANGLESLSELPDPATALTTALEHSPQEPLWVGVLFEFLGYAVRDEQLRERAMGICGQYNAAFVEAFTKLFEGSQVPPGRLASALAALMDGLWLSAFVFPDRTDMSVFSDVVSVMLTTRPVSTPPA